MTIALLLAIGSFVIFMNSSIAPPPEKITFQDNETEPMAKKIYAEISGAVVKPGVYELKSDARLEDLLELARGLSDQADKTFFARNFNLARYVQDQEKVYIPSSTEVVQGIFSQNQNLQSGGSNAQPTAAGEAEKININTASESELDTLPGIGEVTAQKIINGRPYQTVDELLSKKIVGQSVFDRIKEQIAVN